MACIFKDMRHFSTPETQELCMALTANVFWASAGDGSNRHYPYLTFLISYGAKNVVSLDADIIFHIQALAELNPFTIKVSVKIGKVMRKEEIQCKELNEEQKYILKTYRIRTAKK